MGSLAVKDKQIYTTDIFPECSPVRHPKSCKWDQGKRGCNRGQECLYLHGNANLDDNVENLNNFEAENYECVSCRCSWNDRKCVKEHNIRSTKVFFCLNCDDWVKDKSSVFEQGWSLFDQAGYLVRYIGWEKQTQS